MDGGVVDCVIVTGDDIADEFERLAGWHDGLGIRTVVRSMSWIDSRYSGSDPGERVREFLKDAYTNWGTVYAVLGGDPSVVPMRYAWTNHYGGAYIPTDAYYADLSGNWNANGNSIFGEYGDPPSVPGDEVMFYPQVLVGRAPVRTEAEATAFIDKTINYVQDPDSGFPTSALFLGEVIFPIDWEPGEPITLDGGVMCDTAAAYMPAYFDTSLLYQRDGTMNRTTCIDGLNEGSNYIIIAGHGDAFRTSAAEGDPPYLSCADFDTLSNDKRFGFCYALNCNNSAIDVDCVFKHGLFNPNGGVAMTYATTRYDFPNVGQYFLNEFLHYVFQRGVSRVGDACGLHHHRFIPSGLGHDGAVRWSLLTYLLCGDPVVRLWTTDPEDLLVTDPGTMALEDSLYSVTVEDGGGSVEGAVVVMMGDRGEYSVGVTGSDGVANLRYRPRGLGWVDLVVSGEGYFPAGDSVEVTGAGGRLYVSGVSIDDGAGWTGNDDGEAGWGERVGLGVGLTNGGSGVALGVEGSLRVVAGCSLNVDVELDGARQDSLVHIGRDCLEPSAIPFGIGIEDDVFGRCECMIAEETGCWIWLDAMGWHVRLEGDGDSAHAYRCSLDVIGEVLGYGGYGLESTDTLTAAGGSFVITGRLDVGDFTDGIDLVVGDSLGVTVHGGTATYGNVAGSEVMEYYDVGFSGGGAGDRAGIWFETEMTSGGDSWTDWFRVVVRDGEIAGERLLTEAAGVDTLDLDYGIRNIGAGGLTGLEGRLRGLSGVDVLDSVSAYGSLCSGCYSEGDGYSVRLTGGPVSYEIEIFDAYGRSWTSALDERAIASVGGVGAEVGAYDVALTWSSSGDSLLKGYDIFRADTYGGPYSMVGMVEGYARLVDEGLASEESYYYYVCVRDSLGNVSAPSETLEVWTGAPYRSGWPTGPADVMPSSVVLANLDGLFNYELIVGSKDQKVYCFNTDGSLGASWPKDTGEEVWSSAAVGQLDDDPDLEFAIGSNDGYVYAWNHNGTGVKLSSGVFGNAWGEVRGAPAIDDLDNDEDFEIIAATRNDGVWVWHHDGTGFLQPNGNFATADGPIFGSPAIADIDGDLEPEILVATFSGTIYAWNTDGSGVLESTGVFTTLPGPMQGSIAAGDVDNDGDMEIAIGGLNSGKARIFKHDGNNHPGWPKVLDGPISGSPALADLDDDDMLDLVIGTERDQYADSASMYVFADNGDLRPGWPQRAAGDFASSPVVGDVSGDGRPDIVAGCTDGRIYAWHADGTSVNGWPRNVGYEFYGTASLVDMDNDELVEIVIGGYDALIHVFDTEVPYDENSMEWPKLCHDLYNSGCYAGPARAGTRPDPGDGSPLRLSVSGYPNPSRGAVGLRLGIPSSPASEQVSVDVYNVLGRHVKQVHGGRLGPGYHELTWDGKDKGSHRVASGIYFVKVSWRDSDVTRKIVLTR
jgi:WD40 repeat protein